MDGLQKFEYITQWYADNSSEKISELKVQENADLIFDVENLIGKSIPRELKEIFTKYNGEDEAGYGRFMGHSLLNLEEVKREVQSSKSLIKPENPRISNPEESERIICALNVIYRSLIPEEKTWGLFKKNWYKLIYDGSANSRGGPYFYRDRTTSVQEREILRLSKEQGNQVLSLFRDLQVLEREDYNWDKVECALYGDGSYSFERKFYNPSDGLSSIPKHSIKTIYHHLGWVPVIKDHGGNLIGIDLDPDESGTKGQVIVYGRDEMEMFVLANSWIEFLDFVVELIQSEPNELLESSHLHDYFKGILVQN